MYLFQKAVPVWGEELINTYNQFVGFRTELDIQGQREVDFAIAVRSYYRLYINGKIVANGPARAAKNHCRVDEIKLALSGKCQIAVEVVALDKPEKYCNDCTLEPGLFIAEITDGKKILSATGDGTWRYKELLYRSSEVETMSHSRGIIEVYNLDEDSYAWLTAGMNDMKEPGETKTKIAWQKRRAPYPSYRKIEMNTLQKVCDMKTIKNGKAGFVLGLARYFNKTWYECLKEENCFLESLRNERDVVFSGNYRQIKGNDTGRKMIQLEVGDNPAAVVWRLNNSELGFLNIYVETENDCILDIINSDHLSAEGILKANSYVTRYYLKKGRYDLATFEPKMIKYIKIVCRSKGAVKISAPYIVDDSYPDDQVCSFECSDGELNMIYEAARRTLRLSTLDIFMDCPQRERGGWLCDSYFAAHAAWQMFGDLSVEKDFIENFMLTDPQQYRHAFFPEVYPGVKPDESDPGIMNWSFWLLLELAEYYRRSGDHEFIEKCYERVEHFITGVLTFRGESGLLEHMDNQFVDWSLSNREFMLNPISIPNNCLAVYMLEEMSQLYGQKPWAEAAADMRKIIESLDGEVTPFGGVGDAAEWKDGKVQRKNCQTESGVALEIFSGFHRKEKGYIKRFVNSMGTAPKYRSDPNVGKSNLFIGLMIRYDVLSRLGKCEELINELKDIYIPEIMEGSGTLFENYAALSGCHGFNGAAGAYIVNNVLGLGQPMQLTKTVRISPHPGALLWANGSAECVDGEIIMSWSADQEEHILNISLVMPEGWQPEIEIPFELANWNIWLNEKQILNNDKQEERL